MPESISYVILRKVRAWFDVHERVPHAGQCKSRRRHHLVRAHRVVVTQSPLAAALVHYRPRVDGRRLEHLGEPMSGDVRHRSCQQSPICLSDALEQALLAFPPVERDLRGRNLRPRVDAHTTSRHDLVELRGKANIPPFLFPRDRDVGPRRLRRRRLRRGARPVARIHGCLRHRVVDLPERERARLSDRPERAPTRQNCVATLRRVRRRASPNSTHELEPGSLEQCLLARPAGMHRHAGARRGSDDRADPGQDRGRLPPRQEEESIAS